MLKFKTYNLISLGLLFLLLLKLKKKQKMLSFKLTLKAFCSQQMKTLKQPYSLFVHHQTNPKAPMATNVNPNKLKFLF